MYLSTTSHTELMDSILFNQEPPACQIDRYARLYVKLRQLFKKNIATLLVPSALDLTAQRLDDTATGIHIYVDLSNIYIGFNQCIEHHFKRILSTYDKLFENGAEYDDRYCLYNKIKQKLANRPNFGYIHGLDLAALNIILQRGRAVATKSLSGSVPEKYKSDPDPDPNLFQVPGRSKLSKQNAMASIYDHMFDEARKNGYSATIMKRVSSSRTEDDSSTSEKFKEHGVDEILCIQILQTVLQKSLQFPKPTPTLLTDSPSSKSTKSTSASSTPSAHIPTGTIVLATGDGQPFSFSVLSKYSPSLTSLLSKDNDGDAPWPSSSLGFYSVIEKALSMGWNVELYSFGHSLSYNWSQLAKLPSLSQNRFRIVYLDEFVFELATNEMAADLYKLLNM